MITVPFSAQKAVTQVPDTSLTKTAETLYTSFDSCIVLERDSTRFPVPGPAR